MMAARIQLFRWYASAFLSKPFARTPRPVAPRAPPGAIALVLYIQGIGDGKCTESWRTAVAPQRTGQQGPGHDLRQSSCREFRHIHIEAPHRKAKDIPKNLG